MLLIIFAALAFSGPKKSAVELLRLADEYRSPRGTYSFQVVVKDYLKKSLKAENSYKVFSKEGQKVLIETLAPTRLAGRKLLMAGTLWMFLPTLKKPTQVSLQGKLTGEVSNGDIARMDYSRDYFAKIVGEKKGLVKLWLSAKAKSATYRNIRLRVTPEGVPVSAELFAISGKLLKVCEYSEIATVFGKKRVTRLVIKDAIDPAKQSHLSYGQYHKEVLMDAFFDKENLVE